MRWKNWALLTLGAHAEPELATVLGLSFRPSVRLSVRYHVFSHYAQQDGQKAIATNRFSATLALFSYLVKMLPSKVMA